MVSSSSSAAIIASTALAIFFKQLARQRILLVDDAANLGIDLLHRRLGHILVRGYRTAKENLAFVLTVNKFGPSASDMP